MPRFLCSRHTYLLVASKPALIPHQHRLIIVVLPRRLHLTCIFSPENLRQAPTERDRLEFQCIVDRRLDFAFHGNSSDAKLNSAFKINKRLRRCKRFSCQLMPPPLACCSSVLPNQIKPSSITGSSKKHSLPS